MKRVVTLRSTVAALAVLAVSAVTALAAETKGPVTDELGVIKLAKNEPLQVGFMGVTSGADASLGIDEQRGAEILIQDVGGKIGSHPIKLVPEDSACNAEGGQTAATKLAANQKIVVVVGPTCSSETKPAAPILWKAGISMVGISPTAPGLTDAKRDPSYNGFVRVVWNDNWAGSTAADWAYKVLGAKKAVGIHDGSPYAQGYVQVFLDRFKALGGQVTPAEAISPNDTDMKPMLTKVATEKPDVIFYPIFVAAAAHVTRQAGSVTGLEKATLVSAEGAMVPDFLKLAGEASTKVNLTIGDTSPDVLGKGYPDFLKKYKAKYGEDPVGGFHHFGYDAALLAVEAIKKVIKTDKDGNSYIGKKALRDAIFATKGLQGLTGPKNCDANGDCGVYNFTVFKFVNANEPFKLGTNPVKIYPKKS